MSSQSAPRFRLHQQKTREGGKKIKIASFFFVSETCQAILLREISVVAFKVTSKVQV